MSVLPVRIYPDPVLRTPAVEVTTFDRELRQLVRGMIGHRKSREAQILRERVELVSQQQQRNLRRQAQIDMRIRPSAARDG